MSLLKKIGLLTSDIVILYLTLGIMLLLRYGSADFAARLEDHLLPFSLLFLIWLLVFYLADLYNHRKFRRVRVALNALLVAIFIAGVVSVVGFYLFGDFFRLTPKTNLLIFGGVFFILEYFWRTMLIRYFKSNLTKVIVIGDSPLISETVDYLKDNPQTGYEITSWLKTLENMNLTNLTQTIKEKGIQLLIVQPHLAKNFTNLNLVYHLLPLEIGIINFWDFYEMIFEKVPLEELEEGWFIENISTRRPTYDFSKRIIDLLLGFIIGLVCLLPALLIYLLIKITSRGPAICRQKRVGKRGIIFKIYKFRTMTGCEGGPLWTEKNDNRVTKIGKILRFAHLDEIPQLINILRGDISFTGPRPERAELVEQYQKFPYYEIRHIIKPGLSGWAQINYKASASIEEAHEKLRYDIYYVKNRSLFLDLVVIIKTIKYLFTPNN